MSVTVGLTLGERQRGLLNPLTGEELGVPPFRCHRCSAERWMIPIALVPGRVALAVAGRGPAVLRRARLLAGGGVIPMPLFSDAPAYLQGECAEDVMLRPALPDRAELARIRLLWIAGLPDPTASDLAALARVAGALVNVEDRPELCDFHSVAEVRRGDLLLTVSTAGRSPGLAARIRAYLEAAFPPEWAQRVAALGDVRENWRAAGASLPELARRADEAIDDAGWLR